MAKKKSISSEAALKIQLARALADYDNLTKRIELDRVNLNKIASSRAVLRFLPVFDMLISAQSHLIDPGLELVIQEFKTALSDLGVEQIKVEAGDEFNPDLHEVVEVRDGEDGKIIEVARTGYVLDDKILRHAQVVVGRSIN